MSVNPANLVVAFLFLLALVSEVELGFAVDGEPKGMFDSISHPLLNSCFHSKPIDDVGKQQQKVDCRKLLKMYKAYAEEVVTRKEPDQIDFWPILGKDEKVVRNSLFEEESLGTIGLTEEEIQGLEQSRRSKLDTLLKSYLDDKDEKMVHNSAKSFHILEDPEVVHDSANSLFEGTFHINKLTESKKELLTRLQGLKQDLQTRKSKLGSQLKTYRDELLDLKKSLSVVMEQLSKEFQDLMSTIEKQQEGVTSNVKTLERDDKSENTKTHKLWREW